MILDTLKETLDTIFDINPEEVEELSEEQADRLHGRFRNLDTSNILYTNDLLIITSANTYNNWLYYAGFEYIEDTEYALLKANGNFIAVFNNESERVADILEIIWGK